jgi:hypothetical protein
MPWTVQENTFSIETYFETKSFIAVQSRLPEKFQCRSYPEKRFIHRWVQKFREHVRVIDYLACRFQLCLQRSGSHLEHIFERV